MWLHMQCLNLCTRRLPWESCLLRYNLHLVNFTLFSIGFFESYQNFYSFYYRLLLSFCLLVCNTQEIEDYTWKVFWTWHLAHVCPATEKGPYWLCCCAALLAPTASETHFHFVSTLRFSTCQPCWTLFDQTLFLPIVLFRMFLLRFGDNSINSYFMSFAWKKITPNDTHSRWLTFSWGSVKLVSSLDDVSGLLTVISFLLCCDEYVILNATLLPRIQYFGCMHFPCDLR